MGDRMEDAADSERSGDDGAVGISQDLAEEHELDEEISPSDPSAEDQPCLYVQILDSRLQPRPQLAVQVSGAGLLEKRNVQTDDSGCLLISDCGPGMYALAVGDSVVRAHTLTQYDIEAEDAPYRILLSAPAVASPDAAITE